MYETKYARVVYQKEKNAIFCQWKGFCKGNDYRNPFRYGAELIQRYKPNTWITDTTNGFKNEEADTLWLLDEFIPQMIESSIKKIIFIIDKNSPLMDEIKGQKEALSDYFEVKSELP